ncbi:MAG: hypothetical protein RIR01_460, partial [Bacteroidota bacterium]
TLDKTIADRKELREKVRATIYQQLLKFEYNKKIETV